MISYRVKKHRQRKHHNSHMALVPFIDMLTMLVVFLLLHSSDVEILPNTKNISIPQSIADLKPREISIGRRVFQIHFVDLAQKRAADFRVLPSALRDEILIGESGAGGLNAQVIEPRHPEFF